MLKGHFHPTKETLIRTVVHLLSEKSADQLSSDEVLELSGISKGSMYHHFEDFSDLIEHALVARFAGFVDQSIELLTTILNQSKSRTQMLEGIKDVTRFTQSEKLKSQRLERVSAIAKAGHSARMNQNLRIEQERLTEALADLFREVRNRGWGNPDLDPTTVSVLIQSYTMGKIVNDYADTPMDPDKWIFLIDTLLEKVIFLPE
jgi:AcrR family transcriptional regulator